VSGSGKAFREFGIGAAGLSVGEPFRSVSGISVSGILSGTVMNLEILPSAFGDLLPPV
jgi:hypothetical protein